MKKEKDYKKIFNDHSVMAIIAVIAVAVLYHYKMWLFTIFVGLTLMYSLYVCVVSIGKYQDPDDVKPVVDNTLPDMTDEELDEAMHQIIRDCDAQLNRNK